MSAIPTTPLAPEDPEYQAIYDLWVKQGSASYVEKQSEGWLRQAGELPRAEPEAARA